MDQEVMKARKEALKKLSRYGIEGAYVYLIDVIPLIEMVWADGTAQDSEIAIIDAYLHEQVAMIVGLVQARDPPLKSATAGPLRRAIVRALTVAPPIAKTACDAT